MPGCAGLVCLPHEEAWQHLLRRLLAPGSRVLTTSAGETSARWTATACAQGLDVACLDTAHPDGAGLGGLIHLLWWDPSVRAVLVAGDETSAVDVEEVRRAIELTGSDALLLVDASAPLGTPTWDQLARCADLVVASLGALGEDRRPASLAAWSARVAPALARLEGLRPTTYDAVARLQVPS